MADTNIPKLEKLVESIKEIVEITQDKVDKIEILQSVTTGQVRTIKDQQSVMNKKLDELKETTERLEETVDNQLVPSVVTMENTIQVFGDMYKINDDNIRKIEKRVKTVEDKLEIEPSPEHILIDIQ